ncbi:MAG: LamG-like jellyroll fold domain-containing protein [Candidatus Aenigmatarchaeota archaeon]
MVNKIYLFLILTTLIIFISNLPSIFSLTTIILNSPENEKVFTDNNNITFNCSVESDNYIRWLSLYHNISGYFVSNKTYYFGELGPEEGMSLLMHFNREENFGENEVIVYDWSGKGNNGTVYNAVFNETGGKYFGAFEFNGIDSRIDVLDSDSLDLINGTIEVWIKPKNVGEIPMYIVGKTDIYCGEYLPIPYELYLDPLGRVGFGIGGAWDITSSSVNYDEWNHIVVAWNDTDLVFYLNGNLDHILNIEGFTEKIPNNYNLTIGSNIPQCFHENDAYGYPFNGTIDELAIYNRVLSQEEVEEHYNRMLEKIVSVNLTIENVPDGTYVWNCLAYDNESKSSWAGDNSTFYVDLYSPPDVINITFSPSSIDDIDPGVVINFNATIFDPSNVSFAIFQYKNCPNCAWINLTMDNISKTEFNVSFTTMNEEVTYYYRIWSNDTLGRSGQTQTFQLNVTYDYTWILDNSDFGIEQGMINENKEIGTLILNNTGDGTLVFTISDDWYKDVYYNGTLTHIYGFNLPAKQVAYIPVNVTFESYDNIKTFNINISAFPLNPYRIAEPPKRSFNVTMVSYTGGPYLLVGVINSPTNVLQSQTFNLTIRVDNIGNETANNTLLILGLPNGWQTSENVINIGNLTTLGISFYNLTITINPNIVSPGTYTIYINVTCEQDKNASTSTLIGVSCNSLDGVCGVGCSFANDDDCPKPQPGGGGLVIPSVGFFEKQYKILFDVPSRIDINRGESKKISINVTNNITNTKLDNVYIFLYGYPMTFINIEPTYHSSIKYGETKKFEVEIKAPIYAVYKEYDVNITVRGEFVEGEKRIVSEETKQLILVTHKIIENDTLSRLEDAENAIKQMIEGGFETRKANEMLEQAKKAIDEGNYDFAKKLCEEIISLKENAFKVKKDLDGLRKNLDEMKKYNIFFSETEKIVALSIAALERGDYERANERLKNAMLIYEMESERLGVLLFIYEYWWAIILTIICIFVLLSISRKHFKIQTLNKRLEELALEKEKIEELIEKLKKEYFVERKIGKESYQKSLKFYEAGLIEVMKMRSQILSKLTKILKKSDALKMLENEKNRLKNEITELQKQYFIYGKYGKTLYEKYMKDLKWELMEIEKLIESLEG